jgi:hypothetical protein
MEQERDFSALGHSHGEQHSFSHRWLWDDDYSASPPNLITVFHSCNTTKISSFICKFISISPTSALIQQHQ